ncbi:hypothetical protein O6H91_Y234500 [Diphasiastrum complanatum]|nr:hypothetical protein O6H91_Y043600 [Diphasiastrum complanatum]KAJ7299410.1 hypothetical protein O6H91_Y234500 [Diphasiastrum complanatum]
MGTPEFPDLGRHCSLPECNLVDFLPFICDCCNQVFCLEHRFYTKHGCPNAHSQSVEVFVCPMCAKSVRIIPNEDPNVTWENHQSSNCDPTNYAKVKQKPRCPVRGCKEILTFSNKVTCKDCKHEVCLKHRFGKDHDCEGLRKADRKDFTFRSLISRSSGKDNISQKGNTGSYPERATSSHTEALRSGLQTAALTARSSLEAGLTQASATTSSIYNSMKGVAFKDSNVLRNKGEREICPQCGKQFNTVQQLIEHVNAYHPADQRKDETIDVCPKCGKGFSDPISLVNHVERDHKGTSFDQGEKCVIS